jgi:hypothetical protein
MPLKGKSVITLTGRNFELASAMSGKTTAELEILWLEAKMKDVTCSVVIDPNWYIDEDERHTAIFAGNPTTGPLYCEICRHTIVLDGFPQRTGGSWIHLSEWNRNNNG